MKYSDFQPGHRLGKYEIIRELATGGMATIYLARVVGTAGFEKLVVLKCILPVLANDRAFLTMFLDEARLAATLQHANIADVFDVGAEDGIYFFAMEYVHGQNARAVRIEAKNRGLPIPLEVSLAIVTGTASALGYAHDRTGPQGPLGLVHRDVSPSNVLVSYEGAVKLVDFGIARATMRRGTKTRTGMRKGKAPYMSPEQCRGKAIDRRSDLFSLGVMLYELTTGVRPFRGNSDFEVMDAIVHCKYEPPTSLVRDYPRRLEAIIARLLAEKPAERFQSAFELLDEIEAFAASRSLLPSSHVVAKYMRELFGELATQAIERHEPIDLTEAAEYEESGMFTSTSEEAPTEKFRRVDHVWTPDRPRRLKRASTGPSHGEEATRQDPVLPFDPIDARSVEILDTLDTDAPPFESLHARAVRRIERLVHMAQEFLAAGEADKAVTAIELALEEDLHQLVTQELLQRHIGTITAAYEALLDDPYRQFWLTKPLADLDGSAIDSRAQLLLPFIDGTATVLEIVQRSRMPRLEAYHHLCQLLLRGIIQ